jgi:hypothetical protein
MSINDGGPAFPCKEIDGVEYVDGVGNRHTFRPVPGMSLRDYFAGEAMTAMLPLCNNDARQEGLGYPEHIAAVSYGMADAMLKARQS